MLAFANPCNTHTHSLIPIISHILVISTLEAELTFSSYRVALFSQVFALRFSLGFVSALVICVSFDFGVNFGN